MTYTAVMIVNQPPVCETCKKTVWTVTTPPNAPAAAFCQCTVRLDPKLLLEAARAYRNMTTAVTPLASLAPPADHQHWGEGKCECGAIRTDDGQIVTPYSEMKPVNEDQLAQWELVKQRRQKRLLRVSREVSLCCKARVWFLSKQNVVSPDDPRIGESRCSKCSQPCSIVIVDLKPRQEALFVIPAPPTPYRWTVESRWKPERWNAFAPEDKTPASLMTGNAWESVRGYERMTTERQAVNEVRRRRRIYPEKQFRVRVVEWTRHGEAHVSVAVDSENTE